MKEMVKEITIEIVGLDEEENENIIKSAHQTGTC